MSQMILLGIQHVLLVALRRIELLATEHKDVKVPAFDVRIPFHYSKSDVEIMQYLKEKIREYSCELGCEITIDKVSEEKNNKHDGFR